MIHILEALEFGWDHFSEGVKRSFYMIRGLIVGLLIFYFLASLLVCVLHSLKSMISWGIAKLSGPLAWALLTFLDPFGMIHQFLVADTSGELNSVESLGVNNVLFDDHSAAYAKSESYPSESLEDHLDAKTPQAFHTWRLSQGLLRQVMIDPALRSIAMEYLFPGSIVVVGGYALTRRMRQLM